MFQSILAMGILAAVNQQTGNVQNCVQEANQLLEQQFLTLQVIQMMRSTLMMTMVANRQASHWLRHDS